MQLLTPNIAAALSLLAQTRLAVLNMAKAHSWPCNTLQLGDPAVALMTLELLLLGILHKAFAQHSTRACVVCCAAAAAASTALLLLVASSAN
jgi:cell division protein FtsX